MSLLEWGANLLSNFPLLQSADAKQSAHGNENRSQKHPPTHEAVSTAPESKQNTSVPTVPATVLKVSTPADVTEKQMPDSQGRAVQTAETVSNAALEEQGNSEDIPKWQARSQLPSNG